MNSKNIVFYSLEPKNKTNPDRRFVKVVEHKIKSAGQPGETIMEQHTLEKILPGTENIHVLKGTTTIYYPQKYQKNQTEVITKRTYLRRQEVEAIKATADKDILEKRTKDILEKYRKSNKHPSTDSAPQISHQKKLIDLTGDESKTQKAQTVPGFSSLLKRPRPEDISSVNSFIQNFTSNHEIHIERSTQNLASRKKPRLDESTSSSPNNFFSNQTNSNIPNIVPSNFFFTGDVINPTPKS